MQALSNVWQPLRISDLVGDGLADGLGGALVVAAAVVVAVVPGRVVDGLGAGEHELRRPVGLREWGGDSPFVQRFASRAGGLD